MQWFTGHLLIVCDVAQAQHHASHILTTCHVSRLTSHSSPSHSPSHSSHLTFTRFILINQSIAFIAVQRNTLSVKPRTNASLQVQIIQLQPKAPQTRRQNHSLSHVTIMLLGAAICKTAKGIYLQQRQGEIAVDASLELNLNLQVKV
jgi:hypothetical protein